MVGLSFKVTGQFFDRAVVVDMLTAAERKALNRIGARLRLITRRNIKRKPPIVRRKRESARAFRRRQFRRVSRPGRPPFAHTSDPFATVKNILYAYEPRSHSVVTGPVLTSSRRSPTVPELLEGGGTATIVERKVGKTWVPASRRRRGGRTRSRRVTYRARPNFGPTLDAEKPKFPLIFAGQM